MGRTHTHMWCSLEEGTDQWTNALGKLLYLTNIEQLHRLHHWRESEDKEVLHWKLSAKTTRHFSVPETASGMKAQVQVSAVESDACFWDHGPCIEAAVQKSTGKTSASCPIELDKVLQSYVTPQPSQELHHFNPHHTFPQYSIVCWIWYSSNDSGYKCFCMWWKWHNDDATDYAVGSDNKCCVLSY